MFGSKESLPITLEIEGGRVQEAEWGDMRVAFESYEKRFDVTPLLKGLPGDLCQCPHWGYVLKGELRVRYHDGREEVYKAGDAYYSAPGHTTILEAGTEVVEFSPRDLLEKTKTVTGRNLKLQAKQPWGNR